ncbi:MAG: NAD(P)H-dependent flavin oxidoreductase [Promethearchaeota archaeon]|jgi:enoyl-[acyl-carrier protein] reductase II
MVFDTNITRLLGIKHPIIGAPMGPFYTTELTIAVSEAGGLGVLSHTVLFGKSPIEEMKKNMLNVVEYTDKPFGFNIRTARTQPDSITLCRKIPQLIANNPKLRDQCKYVITSAGSPKVLKTRNFKKLKESGSEIQHFHVAPALWLADKCMAAEVDGMVLTGSEGGGHQSYEKVSTLVLLQQVIKKYPDIPLIACGGFATGQGLAAALAMGAGAIAMGSRFIASHESEFDNNYKNIVPPAKAQDTVLVTGFFGPMRLWKNNYALSQDLVVSKEEKMALERTITGEELMDTLKNYKLAYEGNIEDGSILLGQSAGIINKIESVKDIINTIVIDAEKSLKFAHAQIK